MNKVFKATHKKSHPFHELHDGTTAYDNIDDVIQFLQEAKASGATVVSIFAWWMSDSIDEIRLSCGNFVDSPSFIE